MKSLHALEKQTYDVQSRTEALVKQQISEAMDVFMTEFKEIEHSRKEDTERIRLIETARKQKLEDEREQQNRADAQTKWRLQEAEERQKRSREDMQRLEEELWKTKHAEVLRREEAVRRDMEWHSEKREYEWRAQHRELELKAEVKQMEWQLDFRRAKSEKELGAERPQSSSRVRNSLYDAVAAANDYDDRATYSSGPKETRKSRADKKRPKSAGSLRAPRTKDPWEDAEDAIERLVEQSIPRNVARGFGISDEAVRPSRSGRSSRPSSAVPFSTRSVVDDVAADLDVDSLGAYRELRIDDTMKKGKAHKRSPLGKSRSQSRMMSYGQVARMIHQQQPKQRDSKDALPMTLKEVFRSYPEVAQILSVGPQQ
jgi:hypothetical protein